MQLALKLLGFKAGVAAQQFTWDFEECPALTILGKIDGGGRYEDTVEAFAGTAQRRRLLRRQVDIEVLAAVGQKTRDAADAPVRNP